MTSKEKMADDFDSELFRLITRAHTLADHGAPPNRGMWRKVAMALQGARPIVRSMMDERRRRETV